MKLSYPILSVTTMFLISGCATVTKGPVPLEAPHSQKVQREAQALTKMPAKTTLKRKIAIGRFSNETNYGRALLRDSNNDPLGKMASDILSSRLVNTGRFLVFERPDVKRLKQENEIVDQQQDLVGVDAMIFGSLTKFGRNTTGKRGFMSATKRQTAQAEVELKLVDVKTGHIFFSATGSGEASMESGEVAGYGSQADYDATLNDKAIGAAISDLLNEVCTKLDEREWRTYILKVEGNNVFIGGGQHQGIAMGNKFDVIKRGSTIKSPQTGFNIELPGTKVGEIKVVSTFGNTEADEGSMAEIVSGNIGAEKIEELYITLAKDNE